MALAKPGLQPERTALAWQRTALMLCVVSLMTIHAIDGPLGMAAGGVGVLTAFLLLSLMPSLYRHHLAWLDGILQARTPLLLFWTSAQVTLMASLVLLHISL